MTEKDIVDEGLRLLGDKKAAQKNLNAVAKETSESTGVDKGVLKRIADCEYYRGVGWVNGDPLGKSEEKVAKPDKISAILIRLHELIEDYRTAGLLDDLDVYFKAAEACGFRIEVAAGHPDVDTDSVHDAIVNMKGFKKVVVEAVDEIKEVLGPEAEGNNFCPKNKLSEILGLYDKRDAGKDVNDKIQDQLLWATMYEKALSTVQDGSESDED